MALEETLWSPPVRLHLEHSRRMIFSALETLEGDKTIVWDRSLMKRGNVFARPKLLAEHGVVANRAFDKPWQPSSTPHLVFFLSPTIRAVDDLCKYIDTAAKERADQKTLYQVFFIPEAWYVVREKLKERSGGKYWERLESVKELPLWWVPRDGAALSLSLPQLPSKLLINGDWTHLHRCAQAVSQLLTMCPGKVPIYSNGKWSNDVARMVHKMRSSTDEPPSGSLRLNRLVIIDRWLDPLTPLLTQLTYSGMLDEIFGIGMTGSIRVNKADFDASDSVSDEYMEIDLNGEVYQRLRNVHINHIGNAIGKILQEIKDFEEERKNPNISIAEMAQFVKRVPAISLKKTQCATHMRLAEMVQKHLYEVFVDQIKIQQDLLECRPADGDRLLPFIEDAIIDAKDECSVLRLVSIHSLTSGGLKPSVLAQYRRLVMQSYGTEALNRMLKMQKMGLIKEKAGSGKLMCDQGQFMFPQKKKQYKLLVADVRENDVSHPAYAYSGYCSLLVQILQEGDSIKWTGWTKTGEHGGGDDDRTAVFILGGATRAELALLNQLPNVSLVLTSSVITGDRLIDSILRIVD